MAKRERNGRRAYTVLVVLLTLIGAASQYHRFKGVQGQFFWYTNDTTDDINLPKRLPTAESIYIDLHHDNKSRSVDMKIAELRKQPFGYTNSTTDGSHAPAKSVDLHHNKSRSVDMEIAELRKQPFENTNDTTDGSHVPAKSVDLHHNKSRSVDMEIAELQKQPFGYTNDTTDGSHVPAKSVDLHHNKKSRLVDTDASPPVIAICSCARSMSSWTVATKNSLETLMVPSIIKTVTEEERKTFKFQLHLGFDDGDTFWEKHLTRIHTPDWLDFVHHFYPKKGKIPFNLLMRHAYSAGADYMVRINDDTEFISHGWATQSVEALLSMEPSNVGVVGPWDPRNTRMFTHDMVHRTHLDIFNQIYYPEVFSNWWIDDWITSVYRPFRSKWVKGWSVKHHAVHGTRYKVDHTQKSGLRGEITRGQQQIKVWLEANGYNATQKPFDEKLLDTEKRYSSESEIPKMWIYG